METPEKLVTVGTQDTRRTQKIDYAPTNMNILPAIFQLQKLLDLKNK